ncbi:hypothetical protein OAK47_03160 [Planctomycetaceae bacterium]|jgi:hypothetical protein|nr:hypothetical protein [Planctomycetaceae bacterium]MDC0262202.1 hypothetical protein [Planctomycetaceae bacterium]MDC0274397.1 hypothetical protein [Planctomycetaceae bacterium]MDC0308088.1 hypothetical protein [Planctomycetaceae bacterium]MDG2391248.1 hypothetical protein [Planctomycetaceae bacterium]
MSEQSWIAFWQTVLLLGLGSYLVLAIVIVPFGARDIYRLFKNLDARDPEEGDQ